MKILFLDIDGVLNNAGTIAVLGPHTRYLDPVSVALVASLCKKAELNIVVSSSWRTGDLLSLKEKLNQAGGGALVDHVVGETPDFGDDPGNDYCTKRGREIQAYLGGVYCERYLIIDDEKSMLRGQPFIQTDHDDGFRIKHYRMACEHFGVNE